ncbi:MAG: DUF302 domain-containing protein, partial [Aeromicrobium sp.]
MDYALTAKVQQPYEQTVAAVREALAEQGFGVLSEIDVQATLREKRGLAMEPYVILGACNPDLAAQALDVDRAVGVLLPCNVVVTADGNRSTVMVLDPQVMSSV